MPTKATPMHLLLVAALLATAGCGERAKTVSEDTVPRVKTMVARAGGEAHTRTLVGEVQPVDVWNLAFAVPGRVAQVLVNEGDHVRQGQVLARLDPIEYELKLKNAQADLRSTTSDRDEKRDALATRTSLRDRGFMVASALDRYRVDLTVAEQRVSNSESSLQLARRDFASTRLLAPADGVISLRQVEPFTDVRPGQAVLRVDGAGGMQVAVRVPDSLVLAFAKGTRTKIRIGERSYEGRVHRIDARAGIGDSFTAYVAIDGPTPGLRAGVTARVDFALPPRGGGDTAIRIPLQAVLPGERPGQGYVFVLDASGRAVKRVPVRIQAVTDTDMEIGSGLKPGDEVVTAGVPFLSDGQPVRRLQANAPKA
jgi:membrane fusion protein, multidrug efflux system